MKKKIFTLLTLLLCVCSGAWATDYGTFTVGFDNGATQTRTDDKTGDYFTLANTDYNNAYACKYNGTSYAKPWKLSSSASVTFTSKAASTVTIVMSTAREGETTNYPRFDGTALTAGQGTAPSDTNNENVFVFTLSSVAAGNHTITRSSQTGLVFVKVEYTAEAVDDTTPPVLQEEGSTIYGGMIVGQIDSRDIVLTFDDNLTANNNVKATYDGNEYTGTASGKTITFADVDMSGTGSKTFAIAAGQFKNADETANTAISIAITVDATRNYSTWDFATITANDVKYSSMWEQNAGSSTRYDNITTLTKTTGSSLLNSRNQDLCAGLIFGRTGNTTNAGKAHIYVGKGVYIEGTDAFVDIPAEVGQCFKITYLTNSTSKTVGFSSTITGGTYITGDLQKQLSSGSDSTSFVVKATATTIRLKNNEQQACIIKHIELLSAKVSSYGWSTFNSDYALDLTGTDYAYAITGVTDGKATATAVTHKVAKNTPLLIYGAGTHNMTVIADDDAGITEVTGNKLVAVTANSTAVAQASGYEKYVLCVQDSKAVFAPIGATSATLNKGQAYLSISTGGGARELTIVFDDEDVTGIHQAVKSEEPGVKGYYNLNGQRVAQPTCGLYIVNGKKVVIK